MTVCMGYPAMTPKRESRKTPPEGGRKSMQGERQDVDAKRPTSSPRNVRRRRCRPIMLDCCSFGQHFCFALLFHFFYCWPAFQLHEKRALLLFIDLCAGIDFSSDDIYPHFLFAFRAIHRETKRQCILINLCFRLIVANRAINPYRFCGTFICQTVCSFLVPPFTTNIYGFAFSERNAHTF